MAHKMEVLNEFEQLVFDMRKNQSAFFKTKHKDYLERSKQLEKKVDAYLFKKKDDHYNPKLEL